MSLEARGDVTTFLVPVKHVADYARITEGVDLEPHPGARRPAAPQADRQRPRGDRQLRLPRPRERRPGRRGRPLRRQATSPTTPRPRVPWPRVDAEAFEHYLARLVAARRRARRLVHRCRRRRGLRRPGPDLAGDATTAGSRRSASTPRAAPPRAPPAPRSPSWPRARACSRPRRSAPATSPTRSAGSPPRGATRPSSPRMRSTGALTAAVAAGEAARRAGARIGSCVAMSGGVDSAVAALLEREAGNEVVAVTLKLWADQRTDGEKSCCSPQAVLGARALAHSLGIPHLTMDLETRVPQRGRRRVPRRATPPGGPRTRACAATASCGSTRWPSSPAGLGARGLATGHYARVADDGEGPLLTAAADPAKDQTYMLAGARARDPRAAPLPARPTWRSREVRELAAEAGLAGRATSARARTSASSPARASARFLARHGRLRDRDGRDRRPPAAASSAATAATTTSRSASAAGIGVAAPEPLYVLGHRRRLEPRSRSAPREELGVRRVRAPRRASCTATAPRVDRVRLRYHSRPLACRVVGRRPADTPH